MPIAFFRHNTWANLKLLEFCEGLSDAQLGASVAGCFGSIRDTLVHLVEAEADYVNMATQQREIVLASSPFPGFALLKDYARGAGDALAQLATSARADTIVRVERPCEPIFEYPLTGLLVQVLNHSTEHRTQISTILTQEGIEPPPLTGWQYMREHGEFLTRGAPTEEA